jgi:hypothetical protein
MALVEAKARLVALCFRMVMWLESPVASSVFLRTERIETVVLVAEPGSFEE